MSDVPQINTDWQVNKGLSESLWYMFENQILCDVVFEVGKDFERIGAHSAVLAARSSIFFKQFTTKQVQPKEIEIENTPATEFKMFLKYLYTDEVTIDGCDTQAILDIAEKYKVTILSEKVTVEALKSKNPQEFCEFATGYDNFSPSVQEKCLCYVFEDPKSVFSCVQFAVLPYIFLKDLLDQDYLVLDEELICTSLLLWATKTCENNNMEVNGFNQRSVLRDILALIRFPLLSQDFFTENISEKGLLTSQEEVQLLKFFLTRKPVPGWKFKTDKRMKPKEPFILDLKAPTAPSLSLSSFSSSKSDSFVIKGASNCPSSPTKNGDLNGTSNTAADTVGSHEVMRFSNQGQGWGYRNKKKDAVAFSSSQDIILQEIFVYGSSRQEKKVHVNISIKQKDDEIFSKETEFFSMKSKPIYKIEVGNKGIGIPVKAKETYHIVIMVHSEADAGYYGKGGRSSVKNDNLTINFMRSKFSTNNTTESIGQIPGFRYTCTI